MTSRSADIVVRGAGGEPHAGELSFGGESRRCALGRAGIAATKKEGDGVTPAGAWPLRRVWYRADRVDPPRTALPLRPIDPDDGWCDDPAHPAYNRPVKHPFEASAERMWRDDGLYDLVVELGYNDDPPEPGLGSAIFMHVCRPGFGATEGCVALPRDELAVILERIDPAARVVIEDQST